MGFMDGVNEQSVKAAVSNRNEFKQFNIGDNEAVIIRAAIGKAKDGTEILEVILENTEGGRLKYTIFDGERKFEKTGIFQQAFRIPFDNFNFNSWQGYKAIVNCKEKEVNGKMYPHVYYFQPLPETQGQPSSRPPDWTNDLDNINW